MSSMTTTTFRYRAALVTALAILLAMIATIAYADHAEFTDSDDITPAHDENVHWSTGAEVDGLPTWQDPPIITGYADGSFRPLDPITRQEATTVIARVAANVDADIADAVDGIGGGDGGLTEAEVVALIDDALAGLDNDGPHCSPDQTARTLEVFVRDADDDDTTTDDQYLSANGGDADDGSTVVGTTEVEVCENAPEPTDEEIIAQFDVTDDGQVTCADFTTQDDAQAALNQHPDLFGAELDADSDDLACEQLPAAE